MKRVLPAFAALFVVVACASTPSNVTLPQIIRDVEPEIPLFVSARESSDNLRVEMEGVVTTDGDVQDARVLSSPDHRLDDAALSAAQYFVFKPGTVDGAPADMIYRFTVRFRRRGI